MLRTATFGALATLLSFTLMPQAHARYDHHDAERDCEHKILRKSDRYKEIYDVHVKDKGHDEYRVKGKIRMSGDDAHFKCKVEDRRVVDLDIDGDDHHRGHHDRYDDDDRGRYSSHGRNDAKGVIGMSTRNGERELDDLGYRLRNTIDAKHGYIEYWWNRREDRCIAANVKDREYISVLDQPEMMCDK